MTTTPIERNPCDVLVQFMYDLVDFDTHLRQATWAAARKNEDVFKDCMNALRDDLNGIAESVVQRAFELDCFVNGTSRWVSAGSNLPDFPLEPVDHPSLAKAVFDGYSHLSDACSMNNQIAAGYNDNQTSILFEALHTRLEQHLQQISPFANGTPVEDAQIPRI